MMTQQEISSIADQIEALQEITATSGAVTKRAQGSILWPLSHEDLTAVALELRHRRRMLAILSGQAVPNA